METRHGSRVSSDYDRECIVDSSLNYELWLNERRALPCVLTYGGGV
jgi:hypothetical protein